VRSRARAKAEAARAEAASRDVPVIPPPVAPPPKPGSRLWVGWTPPGSGSGAGEPVPVGRLEQRGEGSATTYEFRYLRATGTVEGFEPFPNFPELSARWRSPALFPMFSNRLVAPSRPDRAWLLQALGVGPGAGPLEVLGRTEGRRHAGAVRLFEDPVRGESTARFRFVAEDVASLPGAIDALDRLRPGAPLGVLLDVQCPVPARAVALRDGDFRVVGRVPAIFADLVRRPLEELGPDAVHVRVRHVAGPELPVGLRLQCTADVRWPERRPWPFSGGRFAVIGDEVTVEGPTVGVGSGGT
jgi:hypothetical protein